MPIRSRRSDTFAAVHDCAEVEMIRAVSDLEPACTEYGRSNYQASNYDNGLNFMSPNRRASYKAQESVAPRKKVVAVQSTSIRR